MVGFKFCQEEITNYVSGVNKVAGGLHLVMWSAAQKSFLSPQTRNIDYFYILPTQYWHEALINIKLLSQYGSDYNWEKETN